MLTLSAHISQADTSDRALLAAYHRTRAQASFSLLVERYLSLVYSAALRQVRDPATAEDVSQAVFITVLAPQIPPHSPPHTSLSAWLLKTTWYGSQDARKLAQRRTHHERKAAAMRPEITPESPITDLAPHLDAALARLSPADRSVLALRFFESQTLEQVGHSLGLSKDAANKRLARALARLRHLLARQHRPHTPDDLSLATLTTTLATLPSSAPPASLAATIATTSLTSATSPTSLLLAKGVSHLLLTTKLAKLGLITALILLSTTAVGITIQHLLAQSPPTSPAAARTLVACPRPSPAIPGDHPSDRHR